MECTHTHTQHHYIMSTHTHSCVHAHIRVLIVVITPSNNKTLIINMFGCGSVYLALVRRSWGERFCVCASVRCGTEGGRFDDFRTCCCACVGVRGGCSHVWGDDVSGSVRICIWQEVLCCSVNCKRLSLRNDTTAVESTECICCFCREKFGFSNVSCLYLWSPLITELMSLYFGNVMLYQ